MEDLKDPYGDRVMKNVPIIATIPLTRDQLWKYNDDSKLNLKWLIIWIENKRKPNVDRLRKHLLREGHIAKKELVELIQEAVKIFKKEPNVMRLKEPVIIVGDIHGQYYDMIHMFEKVVD